MNKDKLHIDKTHRERWDKLRLTIFDFGTEEEINCITNNDETFFKVFTQGYAEGFNCGIQYLAEQIQMMEMLDAEDFETIQ